MMPELTHRSWVIRPANVTDAPNMLSYTQNLAQEPDLFLPMVVEDFRLTVVDEERMIARHEARNNALALIAVTADGRIVGMWDCMGSARPALQHAVEFGMSVAREYRGQGVGAALLSAGLAWARQFTGSNWRFMQKIAQLFASTKNLDSPSKDENNTLSISTDATMIR